MNTYRHNPTLTAASPRSEPDSTPTTPPRESSEDASTVPVADSSPPLARCPSLAGKYAILEEGLAGGMGIVYKACDVKLGRIIALKVIKGGTLATGEEITRFYREAQAAARLNHPNIIPVYEIGKEHGCPYFTMAYARGGSLAQHRDRFAEPRAAAALLEKIARAIHCAHQHGILHRDLKPANILFDENDVPLVSDFGLAKFVDATLELTRTGQVLGTPAYMAPEQASGQLDQVSVQTDVWALGVLLYELLTGQRPFNGESQEEKLRQVRTAEPPRPRTLNRSLDRALETVILKCLEKEPTRRYTSAEALADDLARWLRGEPVLARPQSWLVRAGRALRRYRTLALRLVFVAVLLILLALAWRGFSPSVPADEEGDHKALGEKLDQLKRGEKVTLLGKSGPPGWYRWQPRRMGTRTMLNLDKVFHIYAGKQPGMLELLPAAPKRYRLRAQVQHCNHSASKDDPRGEVGIYFAHGKQRAGEGMAHCFFTLTFNDRVPTKQGPFEKVPPQVRGDVPADAASASRVRTIFNVCREQGAGFLSTETYSCTVDRLFVPAGPVEPMRWRSLEVEVTPERVKTFWEGQLIPSLRGGDGTPQQVDFFDPKFISERTTRGKRPFDVELILGQGLGLYVQHGTAAFRSVEIEPLPEK